MEELHLAVLDIKLICKFTTDGHYIPSCASTAVDDTKLEDDFEKNLDDGQEETYAQSTRTVYQHLL